MSDVIEKPKVVMTGKQRKQIESLVAVVPDVVRIESQEDYEAAGARLVTLAANLKEIEAIQADIGGPFKKAMDAIKEGQTKLKAFFKTPIDRIQSSIDAHKQGMKLFLHAEETKRRAAQKLLDDQAAAERKRIQDLADKAAIKAKQEADELRRKGNAEKAAQIEAKAEARHQIATLKVDSIAAPVINVPKVTAAGTTTRKTWVYTCTDKTQVPNEYLMLNDKFIRMQIDAGVREIPGLEIKQEEAVVLTGKK